MKISKSTWLKVIAVITSMLLLVGCSVPESTDASETNQPIFISKEDSKKNLGFNDFVGSISIYNDDGELYFTFAGLIENKCLKYQHKIYHPMATFECEGHEKKKEEKNGKKHA